MATKGGHSPYYPPYITKNWHTKNLYMLLGNKVYDEEGCYTQVDDYAGLSTFLFSHNAMVFVETLASAVTFPYLREILRSPINKVSSTKKGIPTSATLRQGNSKVKIVSARTWQDRITPLEPTFLKHMRQLYEFCGVGTHATPAALGAALMMESYKKYSLSRHTSPNKMAQAFLWDHHFGGRCDTIVAIGTEIDEAIEYDMATGYAAHYMQHGDGTSQHVVGEAAWKYATFFVECEVTLWRDLALGPFPIRVGKRANRIAYPDKRGRYHTYLWREQIEDILAMGGSVEIVHGWAWKNFTDDNEFWARDTYQLRQRAAAVGFEKEIKAAIVGAIGRHGMHNRYYQIVDREHAGPHDPIIVDDIANLAIPYFVHETTDTAQPAMTHWYGYTLMQCARSLYRYALPYAESGSLIMTNYDALLVENEDTRGIPEKHSLEALMCEVGDLRWQRLTHVKILGSRSLICDQKKVRPGVTEESAA